MLDPVRNQYSAGVGQPKVSMKSLAAPYPIQDDGKGEKDPCKSWVPSYFYDSPFEEIIAGRIVFSLSPDLNKRKNKRYIIGTKDFFSTTSLNQNQL